jgi:RNA ligase-like protein
MTEPVFTAWPKTPRLYRDMVVTEKIDGTNAAVGISEYGAIYAQSRKRIITPDDDNFGFARWAADNAGTLFDDLGPGLHFGEWWGQGIQRNYGLDEKRFSLFNVARHGGTDFYTPQLRVVPTLFVGEFDTAVIKQCLRDLSTMGSFAVPGFSTPEGVVVWHDAARQSFKALIENDQQAKSDLAAA